VLESGTSTLALMAELRNPFLVRRTNVPDSWDLQKFLIEHKVCMVEKFTHRLNPE
jgi:glutathione peroxidase-family protein